MNRTLLFGASTVLFCSVCLNAQNLPEQFRFSADGHRLIRGGVASTGFYDESTIDTIFLEFSQPNYWSLLQSNYQSQTNIPATLVYKGVVYDSVGVRFKGQTSYQQTQWSQKKSFSIETDYYIDDQNVEGYETLNLNNGFNDPSFIREVLYNNLCRDHIANVKSGYVVLYINGESWGLYPNVQQLNREHVAEWFLDDEATRWRCEKTGGGGPGGMFGAGFCSLNYLGMDTNAYKPYYKLRAAFKEYPWDDLVHVCDVLNNSASGILVDTLNTCMDVDGSLWYIAHESIFCDDDGYINKGGMDYFAYFDVTTGRLIPIEYDGNECMHLNMANSWSPFKNAYNPDFALLYVLLNHSGMRQRYLAHYRTILTQSLDQSMITGKIDAYAALIDQYVQDDTKKLYSYNQFLNEINVLKNFFQNRNNYLWNNAEVNTQGLSVADVAWLVDGVAYAAPDNTQEVTVNASVSGNLGIHAVNLYFGTGFMGSFENTEMFDDGQHEDGAAGDGVFGAFIPPHNSAEYVRFYVEAIAGNTAHTITCEPAGAEHDVYICQVAYAFAPEDVVINELMADNQTTVTDEFGEYEDWIEFYNKGPVTLDLSGYYLSDKEDDLTKWSFPDSTCLEPDSYLIVWADEDGPQGEMHCNFKLSASGEALILTNPNLEIVDSLTFGQQITDMGLARVPNGTGPFIIQEPTFAANNEITIGLENDLLNPAFYFFPNPASNELYFMNESSQTCEVNIFNILGQQVRQLQVRDKSILDVTGWHEGIYFVQSAAGSQKLIIRR
ncbi:MAG: CotH kinase family protein [Bacteroidales bacterium]|nr:CotH kinase family protein [Bacteroidales bacterium]